jgi:predicted transcriptional regulator
MERHPYTAASRATLESVRHHDGWNQGDTLPVLNREQKLVGMLRHVDLRKGLDFIHGRPTSAAAKDHAIADLYATYSRVLFALCDVAGRMAGSGRPPES